MRPRQDSAAATLDTVTPPPRSVSTPLQRTSVSVLVLLCGAHFAIDLYSAALAALQPLLVSKLGLSLAQAGLAGGLLMLSSSVAQPLYGYLADRFRTRMFTVLSPAVAGVFLSSLGLAPSYAWILVLVFLGGIGVAAFHPQASSRATDGVERRRGAWMATFISAGTMGFAAGPVVFSFLAVRGGIEQTYLASLPGLLASALLFFVLPDAAPRPHRSRHVDWNALRAARKPLLILFLAVFIRSIVQVTYMQLLPLYLTLERGLEVTQANLLLSGYLVAGAIGGFGGGRLADRIGGKRVIQISMIGCVPLLATFFLTSGWLAHAALMAGGLVLLFTIPVNVVMAQELVPGQTGTVSALMMGFAWGTAGLLFVPAVGQIGDVFSLHWVLFALLVFPLIGFWSTRLLPDRPVASGLT